MSYTVVLPWRRTTSLLNSFLPLLKNRISINQQELDIVAEYFKISKTKTREVISKLENYLKEIHVLVLRYAQIREEIRAIGYDPEYDSGVVSYKGKPIAIDPTRKKEPVHKEKVKELEAQLDTVTINLKERLKFLIILTNKLCHENSRSILRLELFYRFSNLSKGLGCFEIWE